MTQPESGSDERASKLLGSVSRRIWVSCASVVLLVAGARLAPPPSPTAVPTSQEHAAPLLEEKMQTRAEAESALRMDDLALRVRQYGIAVLSAQPPGIRSDFSDPATPVPHPGHGVFAAEGFVLTHAAALDGRSAVSLSGADGTVRHAEVAAYEPSSGLVLLETSGPAALAAPLATRAPAPGTPVVGVAAANGSDVVMPVFIGSVAGDRYRLTGTDGGLTAGTPLYSTGGELVAIAGPDGEAFAAAKAVAEMTARASVGERLASIGIAFQERTPDLIGAFGADGALISRVVDGAPAEKAGLAAGDVLVAVGDAKIDSVDAAVRALRALPPATAITLTARRGGRQRTFEVTPGLAYEVAALSRSADATTAGGPEVGSVLPVAALAARGIAADARIATVNGRAVASRAQAIREIGRARSPVVLLLRHRSRQFFATIEPPQ